MLENKIVVFEEGEVGIVMLFGMGVIFLILWIVLKVGDYVVIDKILYGCIFVLMNYGFIRFGVEVIFVDIFNLEEVKNVMKKNIRVVYFEIFVNLNLKIVDLEVLFKIVYINLNILVIVDNIFVILYM